jgi:hypothetical protein
MIKSIELFWNIVYYGIYNLDVYLRSLLGYLNPFNLFHRMKSVQKFYSDRGLNDVPSLRNRILGNRKTGISIIRSQGAMGGLLVIIEYALFNVIQGITKNHMVMFVFQNKINLIVYLVILIIPTVVINNYLLFRKDKYLKYFDEFDRVDVSKKRKYYCLSFLIVILIASAFFLSFSLL